MADLHPPKVETFDVSNRINTDPKGFVREVDEYHLEPFGLYIARAMPGHRRTYYVESWIIPEISLRISDLWRNPGHELPYDFYLDVVDITVTGTQWQTTDLYLDITLHNGHGLTVVDTDELLAASQANLLPLHQAQRALEICYTTIEKLTMHDYDLHRWLATHDITTSWQRH